MSVKKGIHRRRNMGKRFKKYEEKRLGHLEKITLSERKFIDIIIGKSVHTL